MSCWKLPTRSTKIKNPIKILAIFILAFSPILTAQSAFAQTQAEYDAQVASAKAQVSAAQDALKEAQDKLTAAEQLKTDTITAITEADKILQDSKTNADQKAEALAVAKQAVDQAQANYDNNLIKVFNNNTEPTIPGLQADIYTFDPNNEYPERSSSAHTFCKTITVDNIDKDWGGDDIEGCGGDYVIIHYTGFITVPTTNTYEFLAQVDDGWYMTIGDTVVNDNWVLKGCGGWWSQGIQLEAGVSYPIDAWMYEYGGGACNQLLFLDTQTWGVVPTDWFSQNKQATFTMTKDPALLPLVEQAQVTYNKTVSEYEAAQTELAVRTAKLKTLEDQQTQNAVTIDIAQQNVTTSEQAVLNAQSELEAIPPFREPTPTPEETKKPIEKPTEIIPEQIPEPVTPTPTEKPTVANVEQINPQELTPTQVEELKSEAVAILETTEQGSPEYEQALAALFVAAEADDIVISEELAAIPGAEALVGAINFMGNVGADMSPKVREESKKVVVTAVVAVGAAVNAATGAALTAAAPSAAASASAGGSGGTSSRRRND